ncbi:hypothetical protein HD597_011748 [Nonomuraea thailandensis]|uniref:Uncharacterized protein n=1 Tax=Nonomuraea thailandensis TaxID=1188745 RepID=A0A9X2H176_9ACTN|nr:hypothetical protein [Nonomuraea thailandensis]MCP2364728.1 hypothetical protein [Nonomuraea thailandensis]
MNALIRAALIGAVIGIAEDALATRAFEHDEQLAFLIMLVGPVPASMLLSFWAKLPRWWLMSLLGPVAVVVCIAVMWFLPGVTTSLGEWGGRLTFMGLGALGFALAAAAVTPMRRTARLVTIGVLAVGVVAARLVVGVVIVLISTQVAAHHGVPVVAPELPGHRLTHVRATERELSLEYERRSDGVRLTVGVRARGEVTPRRRCEEGYPEAACREVAPGVWAGEREVDVVLYSVHGDALVEIRSHAATRADALAVLPALRPVGWWELAWQ